MRRAAALVALLALVACGGRPRPNVFLVSIDSLRADHLGCYGYDRATSPAIDRLAAEGARVTQVHATTSWTLPSHLSLLTGVPDLAHQVVTDLESLDPGRWTLAETFRAAGYHTAGFYSGPYLHPQFGFGEGFEVYENCTGIGTVFDVQAHDPALAAREAAAWDVRSHRTRTSAKIFERLENWMEIDRPRPWFVFLHFFDVHYDYTPPPPYDTMFDPDYEGTVDGRNFATRSDVHPGMDSRDLEHLVALYDGEIRWVDGWIDRIRERFEGDPRLRGKTILVVTADHGDEFFEHGEKGHRHNLFDTTTRIPLVFWGPGWIPPARRLETWASITDVMPTLLDLAGVSPAEAVLGRSLAPWLQDTPLALPDPPARGSLGSLVLLGREGMRKRAWVSFRDPEGLALAARTLPLADPIPSPGDPGPPVQWEFWLRGEGEDLRPVPPPSLPDPRVQALHDRLLGAFDEARTWREGLSWEGGRRIELPPDFAETLRSLGYVGVDVPAPAPGHETASPPSGDGGTGE